MLNPKLKLNNKMFDSDIEQVATRRGFGEGLLIAGDINKNVVGLCADLNESTQMHLFAKKYPTRFVQVGVAEQNLVTVASGMARMGKIPFVSSYAMFSPGRNWEQIRTTICYNDVPVKIIGSHAGVSVGPDGGTHQAIEDIAIMRVIPNMVVISPCDAIEAKKATIEAVKNNKPTYIRLARENTPIMTTEETPFAIGGAEFFYSPPISSRVGIIATGPLLYKAILVAKALTENGIAVKVLNVNTIKPLDGEAILNLAKETRAIVTVEEHQIIGGLGSAVSEFLSQTLPTPIEFVGIKDKFGQSGTPEELIEHYGLGIKSITEAVEKVYKRRWEI